MRPLDLEFLPARRTRGILTHLLIDKKNEGFTLIEVMIVVAIIAILAAIAIPQLSAHRTKSYNTTAVSDLKNAAIAQEAYYVDNRQYTNSISALTTTPYNLSISQGVSIAVSSANNEAYLMTAYHSAGNITYTLSGPGGTLSP
jgi:prepilin-type N-terminal cleavage/methylation domain-containing protein